MTIAKDSIVNRAPNLAQRLFEGHMLVISPRDSMLHRFNEVGTFVWQKLEHGAALTEILACIAEQFQGFDVKKNRKEIVAFLEALEKKGLITVAR
ncbi:MAG: PqqD family protein [Chitinispirillaceae bacterium]|nr:PqqD family protein [Chitinispirillaceae bacterium]